MRRYALYGAGLIALYVIVAHAKGFAQDESAAASGGAGLVKAFQGR
jgi:hypothetical protein